MRKTTCSPECPCGGRIRAVACVQEADEDRWLTVCRAGLALHRLEAALPALAPA